MSSPSPPRIIRGMGSRRAFIRASVAGAAVLLLLGLLGPAATAHEPDGDPAPGTPAWHTRAVRNHAHAGGRGADHGFGSFAETQDFRCADLRRGCG